MVKKKVNKKEFSQKGMNQGLAIVCLILNIIILPGLGSLIGGKIKPGIWQVILFLGGFFAGLGLTLTIIGAFIGIPLMIIAPVSAWIWGIITGVKLIKESK
jgi:hypothetical protein